MTEHGFKTEVEFGELHISGDETVGYRPYQLLVSSIAVCSGGVLRKILTKKRIAFSSIKINADVERDPNAANRVSKIHLHFEITGQDLKKREMEKVLAVTRKHCAMVQSVKDAIDITDSFELVQT